MSVMICRRLLPWLRIVRPHPILHRVQPLLAHPSLVCLEPAAQELKPLVRFPVVPDRGLGRRQDQAVGLYPGFHPNQHRVRLCRRLAQDHEVIRIAPPSGVKT